MSGFGPRVYLVGCILPGLLRDMACPVTATTEEKLDEAIRVALYITDLTIARMGNPIAHDFDKDPTRKLNL